MPSSIKLAGRVALQYLRLSFCSALLCVAGLLASAHLALAEDNGAPSEAEVQHAVATLKQDPNLAMQRRVRSLKWAKKSDDDKPTNIGWLKWISYFFDWLAQGTRFVLWGAATVLTGISVLFVIRALRKIEAPFTPLQDSLPSYVRELDIRPASLPEDVGASAWQLWERGEQRAALALLYRGLLSRLVHRHAVPILQSSTEAQCLALAEARLAQRPFAYVSHFLSVWQRAVYGGQIPDDSEWRELCDDFTNALQQQASDVSTGMA